MKTVLSTIIACSLVCAGCAGNPKKNMDISRESRPDTAGKGETRDECLRAIKRARVDARNGSYRMYVFGPERYDARFARFLEEYMKTRHGIELVVFGPGEKERSKCYSNEMDKIILNTFGPEVLAEAEQEARELFNSRK